MKDTSDVVCCIVDFGMIGVPMAERLSRQPGGFKKVFLFQDWEEDYSTLNRAIMGDGYVQFERTSEIWSIKNEVDLFVFPDVQRSSLQLELEAQGKTVWGSRGGDCFELDRELFLATLKQVGLEVPPHKVIVGLNALRAYVQDKKDLYIKVSLYRGSFETCHFRSWKLDECLIDLFAIRFGPAKELVRFLVFPNIETPLELGCDTYCIDGQWPSTMLYGVEYKDRSYLGSVSKQKEMPKQLVGVMEKFGPVLLPHRYRNQFSFEVRVKGDKSYFIDATCRMGLPSTASQLELWKNWPDIVWKGANGQLVEPIPIAKYSAEAILTAKRDPNEWAIFDIPQNLKQWCKFASCFEYEGSVCFPSEDSNSGDDVGWLVAVADSPGEVIKKINRQADDLPDGLEANTEHLAYVLKEIHLAEKQGAKFGQLPVPGPEFVMK